MRALAKFSRYALLAAIWVCLALARLLLSQISPQRDHRPLHLRRRLSRGGPRRAGLESVVFLKRAVGDWRGASPLTSPSYGTY